MGDLGAPVVAERVEEPSQDLLIAAWRGPHQPAGVMVHHNREVLVAALVLGRGRDAVPAFAGRSSRPRPPNRTCDFHRIRLST